MITLGIDSGTQSVKVVALDTDRGVIVGSGSAPHAMVRGLPEGHLEQEPEGWVEAADAAMRACLESLGTRREEVRAIGVSGQQHGLVVLDERHAVIRPAKLWCDTSTAEECGELHARLGGAEEVLALTGNLMLPGYTAPKILWLKKHEPEHYRRVRHILLPHDYLNFWLTGELRMEYGDASGTALLDIRKRTWSQPVVDVIDPDLTGMLPPLGSSREPAGLLREGLREAWGLSGRVMVSAGGGDNMMGAIGTGNVRAGVVTASLGTSGTLYAFATGPVVDNGGEVAAFCDSTDHWLPLVCTMNVTVATEQVRKLFGWSHAEMDAAVMAEVPGCGGLRFLPYLQGERTPNLPKARGVFHGLTTATMQAGVMARAVMEGVTLGLAYGLERLQQLGVQPEEIRLTGGGANSAVWRQMCADIFRVPVVGLVSNEGAALGAAIQADWIWLRSDMAGESFEELAGRFAPVQEATRCEPRLHDVYAELLGEQGNLSRRLFGERRVGS